MDFSSFFHLSLSLLSPSRILRSQLAAIQVMMPNVWCLPNSSRQIEDDYCDFYYTRSFATMRLLIKHETAELEALAMWLLASTSIDVGWMNVYHGTELAWQLLCNFVVACFNCWLMQWRVLDEFTFAWNIPSHSIAGRWISPLSLSETMTLSSIALRCVWSLHHHLCVLREWMCRFIRFNASKSRADCSRMKSQRIILIWLSWCLPQRDYLYVPQQCVVYIFSLHERKISKHK